MHLRSSISQAKLLSFFLFIIISVLSISSATAHEIRPSIVDISFDKTGNYTMSIKTNLEAMIANIGTKHQDTNESNNAQRYNELRQMPFDKLIQEFSQFETSLIEKIQLNFNGKPQKIIIESVDIPDIGDIELARDSTIHFTGTMPANTINLSWQWDASFGNAVLRVSSDKNPELYSTYLLDGDLSIRIPVVGLKAPSKWQQFKNYVKIGFVHIVPKGLDHILFVVGLFLLSTQLRPLLIQITTFTLAHSVTLALGIYGVVTISSAIVEPLIAASIIYVCIENVYADKLSRWRPIVVFLFGLLHGLGFASVLKEIGLESSNFITGLVAFNVGVEIGQLVVIAVCFLAIGFWFRHKPWYRERITIPASIVIAIIATYWLVERTLLA
jgi:hydrogenase/urease accessory protein HupE